MFNPLTILTKGDLGVLLEQLAEKAEQNGERADASDLYQQAADMQEPKFGKDNEYVVKCRAKARELRAERNATAC